MISTSVNISVSVEANEDGSFTVKLFRSSTTYKNGEPIGATQPTEFGRKNFPTLAQATADAQRVANHFGAQITYP